MVTFETPNFRVELDALPDHDVDMSWDDDGSVRDALERGIYECFCARVSIVHKETGITLGQDHLGQCIYSSLRDFRATSGYYKDMVREAVAQARATLAKLN